MNTEQTSKNIFMQYFLEDNLEWIVNPNLQLSSIIRCRDIANSKKHKNTDQELTDQILNLLYFA